MAGYTFRATVDRPIDEVRPPVEAALKNEGFGVLTEIDVKATLKAKLDVDRSPYLILGACNPWLAHRALEADPSIGALLPCNVVLRQADDPATTIVEILDPLAALGVAGREEIQPIATEAAERLRRVLDDVVGSLARAPEVSGVS
jgi:uncharacterized protein (DUF302 family)